MRKLLLVGAAIAVIAAPAFAADVVVLDNLNGPFYTPLGYMDVRPAFGDQSTCGWYNIGYGSPALYDKYTGNLTNPVPPSTTPDGSEAQAYEVPGSAYSTNPTVRGTMAHLDGGAAVPFVDLVAFANANGTGTVDTSKPFYITGDVMVRMDNPSDYANLAMGFDWWFEDTTDVTIPYDGSAGNNVWVNDMVLDTVDAANAPGLWADNDLVAVLYFNVDIINASAGDMEFYIDDLQLHYNIPEPATMALLGLGGIGLLRRRRHA